MSRPVLEFWFDFASTYSYPAAMRIGPLADAAGIAVQFRPFLLGPIFKAQGWDTSPFNLYPAKGRHMWRDVERICEGLGLPFRRPQLFPQNSLLAARLALVGLRETQDAKTAAARPWGPDFCRAVFRAEFADGKRIDEPQTMRELLAELKIDAERAIDAEQAMAAAQSDAIKNELRAQTDAANAHGVFGAPTFLTAGGELFWGNDRLETALAWAKRAG
jgi:2-hydroxychromene-2-carboxylate isomerase